MGAQHVRHLEGDRGDPAGLRPVGFQRVLAAQPVRGHPGRTRQARIELHQSARRATATDHRRALLVNVNHGCPSDVIEARQKRFAPEDALPANS